MGIYKKLWVTSYLKIGSPKIRKKARMYVLPTFAQHYAGGSAAAAAKSLQLCLTLCDPIDSSPPGPPHPWDSPGKNTGVGCHFLLQCMKVKSENEVAQSCPTLCNPMDCSLPV